ncbi:MAG: AAA family ATPase, partial [Alphaproteobacteria bacterium]
RAMVVEVPDRGWVQPVLDAVEEFAETKPYKIARPVVPNARDRDDGRLADCLAGGRAVVGVAPDPDHALPELLLSVADARVSLTPPDAAMVVEVIKRAQGGRIPPRAADLAVELLSFEEITSLIVQGGKASESVERLEAAIAKKLKVRSGKTLPRLEDAIEFGAARKWALDLRDDLSDVRKGIIGMDQVDRGAVLFGPPGTGKTLLAQMLGEACGIPTVIASVAEFFATTGGYLDNIIKAQRKVFAEAKAKAPCILFLDEINSMPNADTVGDRNKDYWMPVILDFYTLLDGAMSDRDGVIVVGATNRIEDINPALLRAGRMERSIYVGPPDVAGVQRIMRHHLAGDLIDADLGMLAKYDNARQATGSVIMEQVRAARRSARRAGRALSLEDLEKQIVSDDPRNDDDIRRSAAHEAGHAVAGLLRNTGELIGVNIMHTDVAGGGTQFEKQADFFRTRSGYEDRVIMLLAGRGAEQILLGEPSQGAGGTSYSDLGRATNMVAGMFASVGLGDSLVFRAPAEETTGLMRVDRVFAGKVETMLAELYDQTLTLLRHNLEALVSVTDALIEKRFLTGEEVAAMVVKNESAASPDQGPGKSAHQAPE